MNTVAASLRPTLTLVGRDEVIAAVEAFDEQIAPLTPALSVEVSKMPGPVLTLFRAAMPGGMPAVIDIPTKLCSPYVRGKLYDLLCALEQEATLLARPDQTATAAALHLEA